MLNRSFRRHLSLYSEFTRMDMQLFTIPQDSELAERHLHHHFYSKRLSASVGIRMIIRQSLMNVAKT